MALNHEFREQHAARESKSGFRARRSTKASRVANVNAPMYPDRCFRGNVCHDPCFVEPLTFNVFVFTMVKLDIRARSRDLQSCYVRAFCRSRITSRYCNGLYYVYYARSARSLRITSSNTRIPLQSAVFIHTLERISTKSYASPCSVVKLSVFIRRYFDAITITYRNHVMYRNDISL